MNERKSILIDADVHKKALMHVVEKEGFLGHYIEDLILQDLAKHK